MTALELAAADLGSNSFHLIVARYEDGNLRITDRLRERVQLGEGQGADRRLSEPAQERAYACLHRFRERIRDLPRGQVRVVGTNALRRARNGRKFAEKAANILGHPLEVISGREEARLIYLGVAQTTALNEQEQLVVDIGGGSTECILGQGFDIQEADSLLMGCVSFSEKYFSKGWTKDAFERAEVAAALELESLRRIYGGRAFPLAIGCSGTVQAVARVARESGWEQDCITHRVIKRARKVMLAAGEPDGLELAGLDDERKPVLAGGLAVLSAVFRFFGIDRMVTSQGALREGALYDLVGRIQSEDVRDRTIRSVCERYRVDLDQSCRIEATAHHILNCVAADWEFQDENWRRWLSWAARLYAIGMRVAHAGYHKHGAYLIRNSDWAGFSRLDQSMIAGIVLSHRRKIKREYFADLPAPLAEQGFRLGALFRLAFVLHRSHAKEVPAGLAVKAEGDCLKLQLSAEWLDDHPLTKSELERQQRDFKAAGLQLETILTA